MLVVLSVVAVLSAVVLMAVPLQSYAFLENASCCFASKVAAILVLVVLVRLLVVDAALLPPCAFLFCSIESRVR